MISKAMFREFQLPRLVHETELLRDATYHLYGKEALHHLEAICEVQKLQVIQWQPGYEGRNTDWSDVHRRIDQLGKGPYVGGHPDHVLRMTTEFKSPHLVCFPRVSSPEESEEVLVAIEAARADR